MNIANQKLKFGSKGMELVREFEGYHTRQPDDSVVAYLDKLPKKPVWTIGYGVTEGVFKGMRLTRAQAETMFKAELVKHENAVKSIVTAKLDQNEFDALVSFSYNLGAGNLKKLVTGPGRLNHDDSPKGRKKTADAILLYNQAQGKSEKVKGLARRRSAERQLFLTWTPTDLKTEGTPWYVDKLKNFGTIGTAIMGAIASGVEGVKGFISDHPAAFTVGTMVVVYVAFYMIQKFMQKDHEAGVYNPDNATNAPPMFVPPPRPEGKE